MPRPLEYEKSVRAAVLGALENGCEREQIVGWVNDVVDGFDPLEGLVDLRLLWDHLRARHRYEPEDWLGSDEAQLSTAKRLESWEEAHDREHADPLLYFEEEEWEELDHEAWLLATDPVLTVPMLGGNGSRS